jgi:hypothetical protein
VTVPLPRAALDHPSVAQELQLALAEINVTRSPRFIGDRKTERDLGVLLQIPRPAVLQRRSGLDGLLAGQFIRWFSVECRRVAVESVMVKLAGGWWAIVGRVGIVGCAHLSRVIVGVVFTA